MNRSSIITLVVLGAILGYFLTFGAEGTGKCLNELKFLRQVASSDRNWR